MGEAQGRGARAALHAVVKAFFESPELELARPRWFPRRLFWSAVDRRARTSMEPELRQHAPEQLERMEGIARGAEVRIERLHVGLAAELLLNEVAWANTTQWSPGACSAVGVSGAFSADGQARIAKNFDYPEAFSVGFCVRRNRPARGLASLDVTAAPMAGCHTGVNEAGLAVTYNYGYGQEKGSSKIPITIVVQRMLESCHDVAEAERFVRGSARAGGALLTVADAQGEVAAFELSPTRTGVRRGEFVPSTNHYLTPRLAEVDVPRDAHFGSHALPWLVGLPVHASSEARLGHFERRAREVGTFDVAGLEALLRDHGPPNRGDDGTLCRHGAYYRSTCAVILSPVDRSLRVLFGQPCEQHFVEHRLTEEVEEPSRRRSLPLASS